jgi:uncharacterized membrane protein
MIQFVICSENGQPDQLPAVPATASFIRPFPAFILGNDRFAAFQYRNQLPSSYFDPTNASPMTALAKKTFNYVSYFLIVAVALYALTFFVPGLHDGFLQNKPLGSLLWRLTFWTHVLLGTVALVLGPIQFSTRMRSRRPALHRQLGKVYVVSILTASVVAFYISWFADSGWIAVTGFACLAVAWFYTTWQAYATVRRGELVQHQQWMYRSYALTLAAVTLRIILPLELAAFQLPFPVAYRIVAWLCWVPNLVVAEWFFVRRKAPVAVRV